MKPKDLALAALWLLLGAGLGVLADRTLLSRSSPEPGVIRGSDSGSKVLPALARPPASRTNAPPLEVEPPLPPLTAEDFTAAFAAALRISHTEQRLDKLIELAERVAPVDVPQVVRLFEQLGRRDERDAVLQALLSRWASVDAAGALRFAQQLARPAERRAATSAVLGVWADADSSAALAWEQTLPPGSARNEALQIALGRRADHSPAAALAAFTKSGLTNPNSGLP
ncbi:MAG: hypothetical protein ACKODH_07825, partial [Limisphaerales bacterium]